MIKHGKVLLLGMAILSLFCLGKYCALNWHQMLESSQTDTVLYIERSRLETMPFYYLTVIFCSVLVKI